MWLKRAAEWLLGSSWIDRSVARWVRGTGLILAYHNIVPDEEVGCGDASLHLGLSCFRQHLDLLESRCEVAELTEIVAVPRRGRNRPRVAITFDDAYRGAVVLGAAELRERGLPATIFVAPWYVERVAGFWWDAVAPITAAQRRFFLQALRGREDDVRLWASSNGVRLRDCGRWCVAATEKELASAVDGGITVGSHSWSHPNLNEATPDELTPELVTSLRWLRERFANVLPWLAYPYGEGSHMVADAARASGYERVLGIEGGWLRTQSRDGDPIPRLNVPAGLSAEGLAVRLNGFLTR